jgi:hypothetical protein
MHGDGASRLTSGTSGAEELDDVADFESELEPDAGFFFRAAAFPAFFA